MAQYRRRNFLINKPFQLRFCLYTVSWIFALSLVYPYIIFNLFDFFLRYIALDPMGPPVEGITQLRKQMLWLLIAAQCVFIILTFAISIFISHRIAGPLYKLRKFMSETASGLALPSLKFRKGDHFPELADTFNDLIGHHRSLAEQARAALAKGDREGALRALDAIAPKAAPRAPEEPAASTPGA